MRLQLTENKAGLVGAVGIEPSGPLQTRKLFIPRSHKSDKTDRNAETKYATGTRIRQGYV